MSQRTRILAGLGAVLAAGTSLTPAQAAVADPADRPIARIDQIRAALLKAQPNCKQTSTKPDRVIAQWPNWRKS